MSQIPCQILLACPKKISPEEKKMVTRVSYKFTVYYILCLSENNECVRLRNDTSRNNSIILYFDKIKIALTCLGLGIEVDCLKSSTKLPSSIRTSESESTLQKVIFFLAVALKVERKTLLGRV